MPRRAEFPAGAAAAGENLDEVLCDPSWTCPACRQICNCSGAWPVAGQPKAGRHNTPSCHLHARWPLQPITACAPKTGGSAPTRSTQKPQAWAMSRCVGAGLSLSGAVLRLLVVSRCQHGRLPGHPAGGPLPGSVPAGRLVVGQHYEQHQQPAAHAGQDPGGSRGSGQAPTQRGLCGVSGRACLHYCLHAVSMRPDSCTHSFRPPAACRTRLQASAARLVERELAAVHAAAGYSAQQAQDRADRNRQLLVELGFGQSTLAADLLDDDADEEEDDNDATPSPGALPACMRVCGASAALPATQAQGASAALPTLNAVRAVAPFALRSVASGAERVGHVDVLAAVTEDDASGRRPMSVATPHLLTPLRITAAGSVGAWTSQRKPPRAPGRQPLQPMQPGGLALAAAGCAGLPHTHDRRAQQVSAASGKQVSSPCSPIPACQSPADGLALPTAGAAATTSSLEARQQHLTSLLHRDDAVAYPSNGQGKRCGL